MTSSWAYPLFLWITLLSTVYMLLNSLIYIKKLLLVVNHSIAESLLEITSFVRDYYEKYRNRFISAV
jgi:hypothetical protein